jgi:hypothetical protein
VVPLLLATLAAPAAAETIDTGELRVEIAGTELTSLIHAATGAAWLAAPSPLVALGAEGLEASLEASALADGQLGLSLRLHNPGPAAVVDVTFPALAGLGAGEAELEYLFPALGPILDDAVAAHARYYGGLFPMQWMAAQEPGAGAVGVITRDTTGRARTFYLQKSADGTASLQVDWTDLAIPAGGEVVLEASLVAAEDWRGVLAAYRRWLSGWYRPSSPRDPAFREAFNLRQIHLHPNEVLGAHPGVFDAETGAWSLEAQLAEDAAAFGGVDWVHLFDWGMDHVHGRVGDYNPWSYLGDNEGLPREVAAVRAGGAGVGLYLEGYLLDTTSMTGLTWGDAWALEDSAGAPYTSYAPSWHVCPAVADWRAHFAAMNARRNELRVGAGGFYIDQLGFGYQYPCYREDHGHPVPSAQVAEEAAMMAAIRAALSPGQVLYSESAPADVGTQHQDGAFTEAVAAFRFDDRAAPVNLLRFGLPDFKTFELLTQDAPLGGDVEGVRLAFFSGEGTRLMGYLEDDPWFTEETLGEIRRAWRALRDHRAAFTSEAPQPLVDTALEGLLANAFPAAEERVWTLYNAGDARLTGVGLRADVLPGDSWRDCWADAPLSPEEVDGFAQIEVDLGPGEVGCVAQRLPASSPALAARWALDEASGPVVEALSGAEGGSVGGGPALGGASAQAALLGSAAWFDGVDDAIALGGVPALDGLTGDFTVAAWVHPDALGGPRRVLAVEGWGGGGFVFGLTEQGGAPAVALTTVGERDYVLPAGVQIGRWTHLAAVVDAGASVTFYVDGHPRGVVHHDVGGLPAASGWWIGSNGEDGHFKGGLDELRVYQGALDAAAVRALADISPPLAGAPRAAQAPVTDAGAVELWWPGFHDPGSGISGYTLWLGSSEGAWDLLAPTDMGAAVSGVFEGLALPEGEVFVTVEARDGAGLSAYGSGRFEVDTRRPALLGEWSLEAGGAPIAVDGALLGAQATAAAWVFPAGEGPMTLFGADEGGWRLTLTAEGALALESAERMVYDSGAVIPAGAWSHVAAALDEWADVTFYVDGVRVGKVYGALGPLAAEEAWVGGGEQPLEGLLESVRLYDGPLSEGEVWAIYEAGAVDSGAETGAPDSPVGDSAAGDTAADSGLAAGKGGCGCAGEGAGGLWIVGLLVVRRRSSSWG